MSTDLPESHPIEQKMAILYYCTRSEGIGGRIRLYPRDFRVEEILPDKRIVKIDDENFSLSEEEEPGLFTELILIKKNVESHRAQLMITRALGRSTEDINLAGTKDKAAITAQRATIWRVPPEKLLALDLPGITIRSPQTTIYKTYLGNLYGNHFSIRIRKIDEEAEEIQSRIDDFKQEIDRFGGIGNFFGHQRFGTRRPITHEIGKKFLLGEFEEGIMTYLTKIFEDESDSVKKARQTLLDTNDPEEALKFFPKRMVFERKILEYLNDNPNDFLGAFNLLPRNLRRIFIHGYQSYLWNLSLSERIRRDPLYPQPYDVFENGEPVLPIIGFATKFADNSMSDFMKVLLEKEGITRSDFRAKAVPGLTFPGSNRTITIKQQNFSVELEENDQKLRVLLQFSLQSGSYATVVLRELMKTSPIYF